MTDSTAFRTIIQAVAERMPQHAETLRELDAALGDGDLGVTVSSGSTAAAAAVAALPAEADHSQVLLAAGKAFATANPSTFAALIGGGLLAAGKGAAGLERFDKDAALALLRTLTERIMERGKTAPGDKTVVDALLPSIDALESADGDARTLVAAMAEVAEEAVRSTSSLQSAKGRAAWVQARSIGQDDPGATAYALFLRELEQVL